jgi:hypothetical protein
MVEPSNATDTLGITVEAASRNYARSDPAFLEQVLQLRGQLQAVGVVVQDPIVAGTKGIGDLQPVLQTLILGGPGLVALCSVAKVWLRERGDRVLRLTTRNDGDKAVIEVDGKNVTDETLRTFAAEALNRQSKE